MDNEFKDFTATPTLTFDVAPETKEAPAPAASSELAEQAADPAFSENNLTPEELQMVNEFSQKIDLHNSQAILQYGVGTQKKMADFSDVLFVSDFDHTMTGTDGTIPLANRRAIAAFTARGGCVTVCTGRSLPLFQSMLPQLPVNAPVILFNGGLCYDFARQAALFSYPIELDARALAADLLRRALLPGMVLYRVGGDEFAILAETPGEDAEQRLRAGLRTVLDARGGGVSLSMGAARFDPARDKDLLDTYRRADLEMYGQKRRFYGGGRA